METQDRGFFCKSTERNNKKNSPRKGLASVATAEDDPDKGQRSRLQLSEDNEGNTEEEKSALLILSEEYNAWALECPLHDWPSCEGWTERERKKETQSVQGLVRLSKEDNAWAPEARVGTSRIWSETTLSLCQLCNTKV
ncbi:Hypothetical predicted protein [Xyrichtys novacula]|nr:Hypothetical predicted protein [Xyrichtys novacula]